MMAIRKIFLYHVLFTLALCTSTLKCPNSWTVYKVVDEKSWTLTSSSRNSGKCGIQRTTRYKCSNDYAIEFSTERKLFHKRYNWKLADMKCFIYEFNLKSCKDNCKSKNVNVERRHQTKGGRTYLNDSFSDYIEGWTQWTFFDNVPLLLKNCDKLYWTSWVEKTTCTLSLQKLYSRSCVDCDNHRVHYNYCDADHTKQENCNHFWSEWTEGPCVLTACNSRGELTKNRQCLFGDNKEASDHLCSNSLTVLKEDCLGDVVQQAACQPAWSTWVDGPCTTNGCSVIGKRIRTRECLYGDGTEAPDVQLCSGQISVTAEQCVNTANFSNFLKCLSESHELPALKLFTFKQTEQTSFAPSTIIDTEQTTSTLPDNKDTEQTTSTLVDIKDTEQTTSTLVDMKDTQQATSTLSDIKDTDQTTSTLVDITDTAKTTATRAIFKYKAKTKRLPARFEQSFASTVATKSWTAEGHLTNFITTIASFIKSNQNFSYPNVFFDNGNSSNFHIYVGVGTVLLISIILNICLFARKLTTKKSKAKCSSGTNSDLEDHIYFEIESNDSFITMQRRMEARRPHSKRSAEPQRSVLYSLPYILTDDSNADEIVELEGYINSTSRNNRQEGSFPA